MKVRDEMKVTVAAYKSLYESSTIFGMRKQVQAEEGVEDMERRIHELERKKTILENQVPSPDQKFELLNEQESVTKGYQEIERYQLEENEKEIRFLEMQNEVLESFISNVGEVAGDVNFFKKDWELKN